MPPAKFYSNPYEGIKPQFVKTISQTSLLLPKALPSLPKPVPLKEIDLLQLPTSDRLIHFTDFRTPGRKLNGQGLCAVVIDSGVSLHSKLSMNISKDERYSVNGDESDVDDQFGHGTHMAGIIASELTHSGAGLAPEARIISIKATRAGSGEATWASIHRALELTIDLVNKNRMEEKPEKLISVVNLSFNGIDHLMRGSRFDSQKIIKQLIDLKSKDVVVVISSGNAYEKFRGMSEGLGYPAVSGNSLNVGAVMNYDFPGYTERSLGTFSQRYFSEIRTSPSTDSGTTTGSKALNLLAGKFILAPGVVSVSLGAKVTGQPYSYLSGTSVSAAIVSGCVLLMQQAFKKANHKLPAVDQIMKALADTCQAAPNIPSVHRSPGSLVAPVSMSSAISRPTRFHDFMNYPLIHFENALRRILTL